MPEGSVASSPFRKELSSEQLDEKSRKAEGLRTKTSFWKKLRSVVLGGVVAGTAAGVADATANTHVSETTFDTAKSVASAPVEAISDAAKEVANQVDSGIGNFSELGGNPAHGKFLRLQEDGKLVLSETPEIVMVSYTPLSDPNRPQFNRNTIIVRSAPSNNASMEEVLPTNMGSNYAIRVTGDAYGGGNPDFTRFIVRLPDGKEEIVGEWFEIVNSEGEPIGIKNQPLAPGEKPKFTGGLEVTVSNPPPRINPDPGHY